MQKQQHQKSTDSDTDTLDKNWVSPYPMVQVYLVASVKKSQQTRIRGNAELSGIKSGGQLSNIHWARQLKHCRHWQTSTHRTMEPFTPPRKFWGWVQETAFTLGLPGTDAIHTRLNSAQEWGWVWPTFHWITENCGLEVHQTGSMQWDCVVDTHTHTHTHTEHIWWCGWSKNGINFRRKSGPDHR